MGKGSLWMTQRQQGHWKVQSSMGDFSGMLLPWGFLWNLQATRCVKVSTPSNGYTCVALSTALWTLFQEPLETCEFTSQVSWPSIHLPIRSCCHWRKFTHHMSVDACGGQISCQDSPLVAVYLSSGTGSFTEPSTYWLAELHGTQALGFCLSLSIDLGAYLSLPLALGASYLCP